MGLTIHFELRLPGSTPESEVDLRLGRLREQAEKMPFEFVAPLAFGQATINDSDFLEIITSLIAEPMEGDIPPMSGDPSTTRAMLLSPGDGCEPAHFGFLRRSDESGAESEWYWRCHCKTQYASNVSDEHFVSCHTMLVELLDYAITLGIQVTVHDETDYWEHRDQVKLLESLSAMNHLMAAFAGRLADLMGPERSLEASIFEHPRFEHLEMGE
ncbi:MAG: hypothetical protein ABIY52_03210 [Gemmatimonadaceae bacterium]